MVSAVAKAGYAAKQGARVAWYMAHYYASRRSQSPLTDQAGEPFRPQNPTADRRALMADLAELFRQDLRNVESGCYPMPVDDDGDLSQIVRRSRMFFRDLSDVDERRRARRNSEVFTPETRGTLPRYYLQNFHYQTGGYLTGDSAALYDLQVEVLFSGSANAMRRQALVPISKLMRGRDQRKVHLLDLACGTGRFLKCLKDVWPRMVTTGVDLSKAYLREARAYLEGYSALDLVHGNAETIPLADASQDIVTSIYLFHELPPKVRRIVAGEIARVLKPSGMFVLLDSLQAGDRSGYDGLLEAFQVGFHEPYFASYAIEDFAALFAKTGLAFEEARPAFLSKVMVFRKTPRGKTKTIRQAAMASSAD